MGIPPRREVVAAYLIYLLQTHRLAEAGPVAVKLAAEHDAGDLTLLYAACDALLDGGNGGAALELWTALGQPRQDFDRSSNRSRLRLASSSDGRSHSGCRTGSFSAASSRSPVNCYAGF